MGNKISISGLSQLCFCNQLTAAQKKLILAEQLMSNFLGFFILGTGLEFLFEQFSEWLYPP